MKILFLTRRFYPDIGGVEKHVFELSKELVKRGYRVTVITESPPSLGLRRVNPLRQSDSEASNYHSTDQSDTHGINLEQPVKSSQSDTFEAGKIRIFRLSFGHDNWFKKFRIWHAMLGVGGAIRDADVVHCHDVFFWYIPFRFLFPHKKVYTTFHGYETKFPPSITAKFVRKISERLSYGNICVGDYIKKWYGTKPDFVTYGGVETQNLKLKTQNFSKNRKRLNILLLGRLEEDNGAVIYLEALRILKDRKVPYNLTVLGDGKFKKKLETYGRVRGLVISLSKYIDRADFIFASSYLSILEGLIRCKNVFSVFQSELKKDYLRLSPLRRFVYISGDADSLVKQLIAVQNVITEPYNKRILARNWAKKQTWGKVTDKYLQLWKI